MKRKGFIRYSLLVTLWLSISMSSTVLADCIKVSENITGECMGERQFGEQGGTESAEHTPIIYSGAAITMGAQSTVFGDIQSVAAVTLGDSAQVSGGVLAGAAVTIERAGIVRDDVIAGEAATLGASAKVLGDLAASGVVFIGAGSEILGDLTSGDNAELGAGANVVGKVTAANTVTLGAHTKVGNSESWGAVQAVTGPIILGRHALVTGDASAGTNISIGHNAEIVGNEIQYANSEDFINEANQHVPSKKEELTQKQKELADVLSPSYNQLATTIETSRDFYPGVYNASALTTTADITLTFVGSGSGEPEEWLFNADTYISFGAKLTIDLVDVAQGSTIVFNAGTYTTIGANSNVKGTFFAGTYITTGENTTISGVGSDCGGMFATNGGITLGALSTLGSSSCGQLEQEGQGLQQGEEFYANDEYNEGNELYQYHEHYEYYATADFSYHIETYDYYEYHEDYEYYEYYQYYRYYYGGEYYEYYNVYETYDYYED